MEKISRGMEKRNMLTISNHYLSTVSLEDSRTYFTIRREDGALNLGPGGLRRLSGRRIRSSGDGGPDIRGRDVVGGRRLVYLGDLVVKVQRRSINNLECKFCVFGIHGSRTNLYKLQIRFQA